MKEASQYFGKSTPQYLCQYDAMIYEYSKLCSTYFVSPQIKDFVRLVIFQLIVLSDSSVVKWKKIVFVCEADLYILMLYVSQFHLFKI